MAIRLEYIILIALTQSSIVANIVFRGENHNIQDCNGNNTNKDEPCCNTTDTQIACNCKGKEMKIDDKSVNTFNGVYGVSFKNCSKLEVKQETFLQSNGPHHIVLENIDELQLHNRSFAIDPTLQNTRLKLQIINSTIPVLPSNLIDSSDRAGRIIVRPKNISTPLGNKNEGELQLFIENCKINEIQKQLINKFCIKNFTIKDSIITKIDTAAVVSHLMGNFSLINNTFETIGKNCFILNNLTNPHQKSRIQMDDCLKIVNNTFKEGGLSTIIKAEIDGDAYVIGNTFPKLTASPWILDVAKAIFIEDNRFVNIPEDGINITAGTGITIKNNNFDLLQKNSFRKIHPDNDNTDLKIVKNKIADFENDSLSVNDDWKDEVFILDNIFQHNCSCNFITRITHGINSSIKVNSKIEGGDILESIDSINSKWELNGLCYGSGKKILVASFYANNCRNPGTPSRSVAMSIFYAFIGIIIAVAIVVMCVCRQHHQKKQTSGINSEYQSFSQPGLSIVMPEQRTYQETEIHVLFDKAEEIDNVSGEENEAGPQNEREPGDGEEEEAQDKLQELPQERRPSRDPSPRSRQSCPPTALGHKTDF